MWITLLKRTTCIPTGSTKGVKIDEILHLDNEER